MAGLEASKGELLAGFLISVEQFTAELGVPAFQEQLLDTL